jgi:hypothetical protein
MNSLKKNQENNTIYNSMKKWKYLGANLMKEVKHLYNENYKSCKKKTKKILEYERTSHDHGLKESVLWEWLHYQKQTTC